MDRIQAKQYFDSLSKIVKDYNSLENNIQIKISIAKSKYNYTIAGKKSNCRIIYDPLHDLSAGETDNCFICYTESELKQIIDYMLNNQEYFLLNSQSDDVYAQDNVEIIPYNDSFSSGCNDQDII